MQNHNINIQVNAAINRSKVKQQDWGMTYTVPDELDAFRIAYGIRNIGLKCKVEFYPAINEYCVTLFNQDCAEGIDQS